MTSRRRRSKKVTFSFDVSELFRTFDGEMSENVLNSYEALTTESFMTNKNRKVLNQIKAIAKEAAPEGSQVILFGSRARGEAKRGSDWDILIVLPKSRLEQKDYDDVSFPFVELGWHLNEQINPIMYAQDEWAASSITPFYDNVLRDGIKLI